MQRLPGLFINNIPPELYAELKHRAARNCRSLTQEVITILEVALRYEMQRPTLEEIRKWRVRRARPLTDAFLRRAIRQGRL